MKVKGKLIRQSLKPKSVSVGKLCLSDLEKQERPENASSLSEGRTKFADALQIYPQRLLGDASLKPRTKAHRAERIAVPLKRWPFLKTTSCDRQGVCWGLISRPRGWRGVKLQ
jgi:hypothetical protein